MLAGPGIALLGGDMEQSRINLVALNPQPLPPNGTLEFVVVTARPAE
jgi:hypothetical protein